MMIFRLRGPSHTFSILSRIDSELLLHFIIFYVKFALYFFNCFFFLSSSFDIKVYNWVTKIYFALKHVDSLLTLFFLIMKEIESAYSKALTTYLIIYISNLISLCHNFLFLFPFNSPPLLYTKCNTTLNPWIATSAFGSSNARERISISSLD